LGCDFGGARRDFLEFFTGICFKHLAQFVQIKSRGEFIEDKPILALENFDFGSHGLGGATCWGFPKYFDALSGLSKAHLIEERRKIFLLWTHVAL
jgi:hypothetical protein